MKFRVEFAFAENFSKVAEWSTLDEWISVSSDSAEQAAMDAANADGFENALFRVFELKEDGFGGLEPVDQHNPEYFFFGAEND